MSFNRRDWNKKGVFTFEVMFVLDMKLGLGLRFKVKRISSRWCMILEKRH